MLSYLQPNIRIFSYGKVTLKIWLLFVSIVIFSAQSMTKDVYEAGTLLEGYIQKNSILKEQSDDALFLSEINWKNELRAKYGKNEIKELSKGVVYVKLVKYINSRRVLINVSEINRNVNPKLEVLPQLSSDKMHSKSNIGVIANRTKAILAVNGTYFKQDTGTPLGTLVINNEIISGPIYNRAAFGIGDNCYKTERIGFNGILSSNKIKATINNINRPRMMHNEVILYTNKWGVRSPKSDKSIKNIAVKDDVIVAISSYPVIIPSDGYAVSAPKEIADKFELGETIKAEYSLNPQWLDVSNIISGGPYLLKKGKIYIDAAAEKLNSIKGRNPRTALGYTKNNVLIIVTIDGRKEGSSGVTLAELAKIMENLGCYEAINLDGGSSTVMYESGKVHNGTNIKYSASVSNVLVVRNRV